MRFRSLTDTTFLDRRQAGRQLAARLAQMTWSDPVVFGLARGGVPVGYEIAKAFDAPLEVAVARKIGAPYQPEFGVGAVTADGPPLYNERTLSVLGLTPEDLEPACARERSEARRRLRLYRTNRPETPVQGRDVIVADDGLATGVTARATLRSLRQREPARLVFAAPVCARDSIGSLYGDADEVICVSEPVNFGAVGRWYRDFRQTTDDEVLRLLEQHEHSP